MSESTQERGISKAASRKEDALSSTQKKSAGRIAGLTLGVATAAASVAQAAPVQFGADVNRNRLVGYGHLNQTPIASRVSFSFDGGYDDNLQQRIPLYEKQLYVEDDVNGGIVVRGLGQAGPVPPWDASMGKASGYIELDRGDGTTTRIARGPEMPGVRGPQISVDSVLHWDDSNGCDDVTSIHRDSFNPRGLLVTAGFNEVLSPARNNVWRVNVDQPGDWCQLLKDQITAAQGAGQNMFQANLLDRMESTGHDEAWFAADENLAVSSRDNALSGTREFVFLERRDVVGPPPNLYHWYHLRADGDGTWSREVDSINGTIDNMGAGVALVESIAKLTTPGGRTVHIMTTDAAGVLAFRIFERVGPGDVREVPARLDEVDNPPPPDTDGDGVIDSLDNAPLRANPGQVDTNNDGIGDAAQADCTGNFPGVNAEGAVNASGLRICANSELGYTQVVSDSDGSTYHSNGGEVVLAHDGDILAQPGQELRIIHSKDPRTPAVPPRDVRLPDGNSVQVEFFETARRDGTPGTATLTGFDLDDNPVRVVFNGPTARRNLGVVRGGVISTEGTDFVLVLGNENPVPNTDVDASVVDAAADAAVDAVVDAAPPVVDAAVVVNDAALQDAAIADAAADAAVVVVIQDAAVPVLDAATPDLDASIPVRDASPAEAGLLPQDAAVIADASASADVAARQDDAIADATAEAVVDASVPPACIPSPEICDGLDNDCDNEVDTDENGEPMTNEVANECEMMMQVCVDGELLPPADVMRQPLAEQCNGADDDCDGTTDEGMDSQCENECGNVGMIRCVNAQMTVCDAPVCSPADASPAEAGHLPADGGVSLPQDAEVIADSEADASLIADSSAPADVANMDNDRSSASADAPTVPVNPSTPADAEVASDENLIDQVPHAKEGGGGGGGCDIKGTDTDAKVPLTAAALVLAASMARRRKREEK